MLVFWTWRQRAALEVSCASEARLEAHCDAVDTAGSAGAGVLRQPAVGAIFWRQELRSTTWGSVPCCEAAARCQDITERVSRSYRP